MLGYTFIDGRVDSLLKNIYFTVLRSGFFKETTNTKGKSSWKTSLSY